MRPSLTVIVCTLERPEPLAALLGDLWVQLPSDAEVVVVDQSSAATRARDRVAVETDPRGRLLEDGPRGLPAARNLGLQQARAPIVWFLDDDTRLEAGCVAALLGAFDDPWVGGVTGCIEEAVVRPNARHTTNRIGLDGRVRTNLTGRRATDVRTLKGAHMAYRRVALAGAGPCDEGFGGTAFLEDADWSARVRELGWRLRYVPEAAVRHLSAPSGGVRTSARGYEAWRFHATGRFVRRHRPWSAPLVLGTFAGIAAVRAVRWHEPAALPGLVGQLVAGWRSLDQAASVSPSSGSGSA